MLLTPFLQLIVERKASDLFVSGGAVPQIRLEGRTRPVGKRQLTPEEVERVAHELMGPAERRRFEQDWEVDFACRIEGLGRFRVNVFRQRGEVALALRFVHPQAPEIRKLGLPLILQDLALAGQGLVLMAGPTGCGKSTTLAAMVNHRNQHLTGHILTIEDPIEFFHHNQRSIVNQRELGVDTRSYRNALRSALRESPDVVMIGEVRDRETMEAAVELAGTGHLTLATIHANNAPQALDRIANLFPNEAHKQLFMDLSLYLNAIISQRLVVSRDDESRVAAVEVMLNTPYIADLISKGHFDKLKAAMEDSKTRGMQDMDTVLYQLYLEERITLDEALSHADSRPNLEAKINFSG
ncbi:MAG TPA: PilT/PilU family type 4a pilus ATPase [Gammaproteobacteria bacterium]|nr:PilT/PilU family type 4a pilus ATPase [Gammaproteobacteria bacterium]